MNFALKSLIVLAIVSNGFIRATVNSFYEKFANVSVPDDCETNADSEEIFGQRINYYSDDTGNVFCFRKINGVVRMSSTSRPFEDPRFMCSKGPMSCSSYSMKRILPDEYENFCRNPDENPLGPWCHVEGGLKVPCFEPCRLSSSDFVCLNRDGFPYTDVEMSDIFDLPQLIGVFKNVHLMYESRFVIRLEVDRLSTKSCINKGNIASFFGPWISVFDEMAKDFVKIIGRRVLRDLCAPIDTIEPPSRSQGIHHDAIIEDELTVADCSFWRRCFSSCQDDLSNCWKKGIKGYYGSKTATLSGKSCLPWTQVSSEILKMIKSNSTSYETFHLYHDLLFNDPSQFFVESRLFMNTESSCMLLHRRDDSDMRSSFTGSSSYTKGTWMTEFKKMFQEGPGCFVKHNKTLQFESCYTECEKTPEIVLTKPLCPEGNTYSICKPKRGDDWLKRGRKVD
ncbi:hypothetical protein L3Y34_015489 [Caenorhabditis briggsae]|uniref:Kringle domain-containing protein n=1 Tax=Caenorhabditis briggsae TaxID=6238 RepID=A0AAE9IZA0_CAEBR|nr:hypothetical protein L3Y34_015489 [Caenorhabditis briggsae]